MPSSQFPNRPELSVHTRCHVCSRELPPPVLDLGLQPLCDDLVPVGDPRQSIKYPIQISLCPVCLTAHQVYQIAKETLFPRSYHYRARFTQDVLNGMRSLVEEVQAGFGSVAGKLVCDVGCNDGSLLGFFKQSGARCCGIEPTGAAADAQAAGHHIIQDYFSPKSAARLVSEVGHPDVITFTNVFAHIESLKDAVEAVKVLASDRTILVIENHYLGSVLSGNQFDTFYHEHPRTYSLRSFEHIAKSLGGEVLLATFPKRYGGNIRVCIGNMQGGKNHRRPAGPNANATDESGFAAELAKMQSFVDGWKMSTRQSLEKLHGDGLAISGKSFPCRASILVSLLGVTEKEQAVTYEKPGSLKIGHYLPGTRIEIQSDERWLKGQDKPPAMLIWGWHIADEIAGYLRQSGYRGRIFTPLPQFREMT